MFSQFTIFLDKTKYEIFINKEHVSADLALVPTIIENVFVRVHCVGWSVFITTLPLVSTHPSQHCHCHVILQWLVSPVNVRTGHVPQLPILANY